MLAAVLDPDDRAFQELRGRGDRDVLRIDAELRAEAAADVRRRDAQPVVVEAEQAHERVEEVVRLLGRGPHRERAVAPAVLGEDAAAFDRMRRAAMDEEFLAQHMGRAAERRVDLAIGDPVGRDDVRGKLAPHLRRVGTRGLPAVRGGGQNVVGHLDARCRVLGDITVLREHDRDGLADIGDFAVGEREGPAAVERRARIRGPYHPPLRQGRCDVVEGEHRGNAGQRQRRRPVHRGDQRMRMRAAHEGRVQYVGCRHVADIAAASGEERVILKAGQA